MYVRITNLTSSPVIIEGDTPATRKLSRRLEVGKYMDISDLSFEQIMAVSSIRSLHPASIRVDRVVETGDMPELHLPVAPDADCFVSGMDIVKVCTAGGATGARDDVTINSSLPFGYKPLEFVWLPNVAGQTRTVASTAYANVSNVQTITCANHGIVQGDYVTFDTVTAGGDVASATMVLRTTSTTIVIANSGGNSSATEAGTITVLPRVQVRSHAPYQVASTAYANVSNVQTITVASHTLAVGDYVIFDTVTAGGDVLTATPVLSTTATTVVIANSGGDSSATEAGMLTRVPFNYSSSVDSSGAVRVEGTLAVPVSAARGSGLYLARSDRSATGTLIIRGVRT